MREISEIVLKIERNLKKSIEIGSKGRKCFENREKNDKIL